MRDHGSIGLFREWCFGEEFGFECFCLFLFCFCLVRGEKVASAQDFGWQSKGEDHFGSWFPFFFVYLVTILYCSDIVWSKDLSTYFFFFRSLIENFSFFFLLSPTLLLGIFFLFFLLSPTLWLEIFLLSRAGMEILILGQGLWWFEVLGQKPCRPAGHDVCQGVGLASGSGIKGMSHIIFMIHMQHWWFGNFMQNWSCMHPCGHSSIKFLWSCDTRAHDSFLPI